MYRPRSVELKRLRRYANPHSAFVNSTNSRDSRSNARTRSIDRSHFLPVRAHILHRRSAHGSGNPGQAFDPCTSAPDRSPTNSSQIIAGCHAKQVSVALDALQSDAQHEARKSCVGDQNVAAAAQHKQRNALPMRPRACLGNFRFARWPRQTSAPARQYRAS